ncbi:MAG: hypothetical protein E7160_03270 [Firmicutes bacterium]|nr:hypothetical protein [Bacillota bacterium]
MKLLLYFVFCFSLVLFLYEIFIVNKAKRRNSKNKPIEIKFLVNRYRVDIKKADYKQMLQIIALTSSFDIALIVTITSLFDTYLKQILAALVLVLPVIFISYHLIGNFYKKRGMIIDE